MQPKISIRDEIAHAAEAFKAHGFNVPSNQYPVASPHGYQEIYRLIAATRR